MRLGAGFFAAGFFVGAFADAGFFVGAFFAVDFFGAAFFTVFFAAGFFLVAIIQEGENRRHKDSLKAHYGRKRGQHSQHKKGIRCKSNEF